MDGARLALMLFAGLLLIQSGVTGKLGSMIAAIIDPANMQEHPSDSVSVNTNGLPTSGTLTAVQIGQYALSAGFTDALPTAIAIALAESGGNIQATHQDSDGSTDYGLWQINSVHSSYSTSKLLTPGYNAQAAYQISSAGTNWYPWSTYKNGAYLQYMSQATVAAAQALILAPTSPTS